jgi:TIR domain
VRRPRPRTARSRVGLSSGARVEELGIRASSQRGLGLRALGRIVSFTYAAITRCDISDVSERLGVSWDLFISYASEDKEEVARPLARELAWSGLAVWFDEFELKIGDSLLKSIDKGLSRSRYGVVILSHAFFQKYWPQSELAGLVQRERNGSKIILPVWYNLSSVDIVEYSPILSDRIAANWSRGLKVVSQQIKEVLAADRFDVRGGPPLRKSSDLSLDERRILFSILAADDRESPSDDPMHAAIRLFNDWSEPSTELLYLATKEMWANSESASSSTAVLWLLNTDYLCAP